ncbi:MAG: SDR family oxidoreductase [Saprospiraceae bacterium]|nr:SDR family oxidoreductase [Saprospiraceae bacterium]
MAQSFFNNKRVWITGASSGIGRELAVEISKLGGACILSARSESMLKETNELTVGKDKNVVVPLDVTDETAVESAYASIIEDGPVDILINNAGVSQRSTAEDTAMSVYRSLMEVNYFGVVKLTKVVLDAMLKRGQGSIVTISSIAGKVGPPYRSGYAGSKHALHGFMDSLRAEISHRGVHVLVVCPGYINTPIAINALNGKGEKYNKKDEENAQGLDPNDLAKMILKAIAKKKNEVYFGKFEVNAVRLKRFWPGLLTKMLSRKFHQNPK